MDYERFSKLDKGGYIIRFGKYKGDELEYVVKIDKRYIDWLCKTIPLEPEIKDYIDDKLNIDDNYTITMWSSVSEYKKQMSIDD